MAYQFIHVECYARRASTKQPNAKTGKASKARKVKFNAREIAAEAERKPEDSRHVKEPLEPKVVFGCTPTEAVEQGERAAEVSTDCKGRKVRADTPIVLAGVASHPFTPEEVATDEAKRREYEHWRKLTLDHLKREYGDGLKSVVEHRDESHMHLHFYAVPKAEKGFNAKKLHDGFRAAEGIKDPKEQRRIYTEAMRQMQDRYFANVGAHCGQARTGPKRERLTREAWNQRQHEVRQLSRLLRAGRSELAKARKMAQQIIENARAKARKPGELLGAMFDGITGRTERLRREHEERLAKEREEKKRAKAEGEKAQKQVEELQQMVVHERMKSDATVDRLVNLKTLPLEKRLQIAEQKAEQLGQQLDEVTAENKDMRQQLKPQQGREAPSMRS